MLYGNVLFSVNREQCLIFSPWNHDSSPPSRFLIMSHVNKDTFLSIFSYHLLLWRRWSSYTQPFKFLSAVTSPLLGTAHEFPEEFSWTPALFSVLLRLYSQCYCQYQWALNLLDSWYFDCLIQQWSVYVHFSYWLTFCF